MRPLVTRCLTSAAIAGVLAMAGASSGCGEQKSDNAPLDPEAQKINEGVQDGMKGFMQSKTQPKGKTSK
jgi:hypothetical protein